MTKCEYHITDTVNNSDSVYCPKCGQQIQLFKPALCSEDCEFLIRQKLTGKLFCKAFKDDDFFACSAASYVQGVFKIIPKT